MAKATQPIPRRGEAQQQSANVSSSNSSTGFLPLAIIDNYKSVSASVVVVTDPQAMLRHRPTRTNTGMSEVSIGSEGSSSPSLSSGSGPPSPTSAKSNHSDASNSSSGSSGSGTGSRRQRLSPGKFNPSLSDLKIILVALPNQIRRHMLP
ncbi:hypothetical protein BGW41_004275 [Actinomortierella wolfii]|nr:hypothetical protein BGW41_004275 [Actinomortierella wolfii]